MRKYHAAFGREDACFLAASLGVAAHSHLSECKDLGYARSIVGDSLQSAFGFGNLLFKA